MKNVIAIIPARSGSKRLLGKNIIPLVGKPMIAWTIEAALKSEIFSDVLVSTDTENIAEISKKYGASVPFLRDPKDADDYTPVHIATLNALIKMEKYKAVKYDVVIQLMPNCPCRTATDINNSYNNFLVSKSDFQISVFRFGWMNPWWAMRLNESTMQAESLFLQEFGKRSQDLDPLYCPSGAIWIARAEPLKKQKTFYGKGYKVFPLNLQSSIDIDTLEDFEMAKMVMQIYKLKK